MAASFGEVGTWQFGGTNYATAYAPAGHEDSLASALQCLVDQYVDNQERVAEAVASTVLNKFEKSLPTIEGLKEVLHLLLVDASMLTSRGYTAAGAIDQRFDVEAAIDGIKSAPQYHGGSVEVENA